MGALLTSSGGLQLETVTQAGTALLTWMLSSFRDIFTFFLENPGLLLAFVLSLVGTALVYFRKLI